MSYQFHGQRAHEDVLLLSKQHPFVLFHPLLISALIFLLPFAVYIFVPVGTALSVAIIIALVIGLVHGFLAWYAWKNTLFLLTTERVVFLEQRSLMHREFRECRLDGIQQVSHEIRGLWQTSFGYGTISVFTAGSQMPLYIREVPDPYELQQEIQRAAAGEVYLEEGREPEEASA